MLRSDIVSRRPLLAGCLLLKVGGVPSLLMLHKESGMNPTEEIQKDTATRDRRDGDRRYCASNQSNVPSKDGERSKMEDGSGAGVRKAEAGTDTGTVGCVR
jgi:hypothetical protein